MSGRGWVVVGVGGFWTAVAGVLIGSLLLAAIGAVMVASAIVERRDR